jgi:hypothetical protein
MGVVWLVVSILAVAAIALVLRLLTRLPSHADQPAPDQPETGSGGSDHARDEHPGE